MFELKDSSEQRLTDAKPVVANYKLTEWPWVYIAIAIITLVHLATLTDDHDWGGDFSHYIHHAKNLAEGKHYLDTGYIIVPPALFMGPYGYPPIFPLILAPVYSFFGLDLIALKAANVLFFCLLLIQLSKLCLLQFNQLQTLSVIVLAGFNPYLADSTNSILPDFTFTFFVYLSLWLMIRLFDCQQQSLKASALVISLLGITMYLGYGTREVGLVLPLTVLTYEIVCKRRISLISVISIAVFCFLAMVQHQLLQDNFTPAHIVHNMKALAPEKIRNLGTSNFSFIKFDIAQIFQQTLAYLRSIKYFYFPSTTDSLKIVTGVTFGIIAILAVIGFATQLIKKITVLEIFSAGYIVTLLLYSGFIGDRYLVPVFPLFLYYMMIGYRQLNSLLTQRWKLISIVSALTLTSVSYAHGNLNYPEQARIFGPFHPAATEMFDFIRNHANQQDTVVFEKPRVMALLTQRTSISYPRYRLRTPEMMDAYLTAAAADYYVHVNMGAERLPHVIPADSAPPSPNLHEVFRNDYFVVYHYPKTPNLNQPRGG